jgi:hypothetical protein
MKRMKPESWKRRNSRTIRRARMRATFYGGRYERTHIGRTVTHMDLSSAYPALLVGLL